MADVGALTRVVSGRASLALAAAVLAVALAVGAGVGSTSRPTAAQRAATIDAQIRCPSCQDLSVAQSQASSAIAVRNEVRQLVDAGASASAIDARLVAQYGPSILLAPPASGLSLVVWVVPAVGGALALAAVGLVLWRRSAAWRVLRREAAP